jgi:hypothetical protein
MRRSLVSVLLCSLWVLSHPVWLWAVAQPVPVNLTPLGSEPGIGYFATANIKQPYWQLSRYFMTQKGLTYCGVASIVMVLNALGEEPEVSPRYEPYHIFDQDNVFYSTGVLSQVTTPATVLRKGMTLAQVAGILDQYQAKTALYYGSNMGTVVHMRRLLINAMIDGKYVIANYDRHILHQQGGGHISPVAAYHKGTDRWLILDVARYRYPPVWVKSEDLFKSIKGIDADSNKSRGFVLVSR